MKVLLIEDEWVIAEPTLKILTTNNYQVDLEKDGEQGLISGLTNKYDVILLDIMLPKLNGFEVLKCLRKENIKTPIIMLTARDQTVDKINGLDCGADDYLSKPFDFDELLARMRSLLRRSGFLEETHVIRFANFELHPFNSLITSEKKEQKLTLKEFMLLELLISRNKMIITKELIIERLWDFGSDVTDSNVEYHVSKLRQKLKLIEAKASINTIRGLGYHLEAHE